ncbi:sensor domain-containing diguanylate cyclase [Euzebya rosea]|uniref:GGDEF domain-containing protein n=1 Tax=Euzebya rosea TaxID=2052804 RepID=UPI000D3ECCFF|nr:GGDEF domain-containing protein [Euzebya rosea]
MTSLRSSSRTVRTATGVGGPALVIVSAVAAAALVIGPLVWAGGQSQQAVAAEEDARWAELVATVHLVNSAALDELNAMLADGLADPSGEGPSGTDVAAAAEARAVAVLDAEAWLDRVLEDPVVGPTAETVSDLVLELPDRPDHHPHPDDVLGIVEEAELILESAVAADAELLALADLVQHASLPRLVVNDAIDVTWLVQHDRVAAPWTDGYFDTSEAYITDGDGGWLGEDTMVPSPFVQSANLRTHLPGLWERLAALTSGGDDVATLLEFDGWVQRWTSRSSHTPPVALSAVRDAARTVTERVDPFVRDALRDRSDTSRREAAALRDRRTAVVLVGLLLAASLIVVVVRVGRVQLGRVRGWRRAALVDQLTGIANRRGLEEHAAAIVEPDRDAHALLLFDLDHFKGINDRYGHAVGDDALQSVAAAAGRAAATLPGEAIAARLGGDEFVVLAHDLTDPGAQAGHAAQQLIETVRRQRIRTDGEPVSLSISVGVATCVGPLDLTNLLMKADIALYEVKRGGRGAHRAYDPSAQTAAVPADPER